MKYIEALELVNKCIENKVLAEENGFVLIVRERGMQFETKESVAMEVNNSPLQESNDS